MKVKMRQMLKEYEMARERERQKLLRMREITKQSRISFIKKLELKKGHKYILFIPTSTGLTPEDMEEIPAIPELANVNFRVESTRGIKAIEIKK